MFIHDLPAELLLTVLELCEPRDAYILALCCRDAHHVLSNVLRKHRKMWRLWNTIDSDDSRNSLHKRILELTRDPYLGYYVETLGLDCEVEEHTYSESEDLVILDRMRKLGNVCLSGLILHNNPQESQLRRLSNYLVFMAPNLRRLECFGDTIGESDLLGLLVDIARASPTMTALPLQHLRVVEVKLDRGFDEGGLPFDWLLASMCLPSVRTFAASRMNCCTAYMTMDEVPNSDLETLILADCTFEPDQLNSVLSKINNLRSFAYSNGQDCNVYEGGSFSPKRVTSALLLYAGHSLVHLTVHGQDYDVGIELQKRKASTLTDMSLGSTRS